MNEWKKPEAMGLERMLVEVRGIVQGVGFRPFIAREARALRLAGWVRNTAQGVSIDCQGQKGACGKLVRRIQDGPPPGAVLFSITAAQAEPQSGLGEAFTILPSKEGAPQAAVSPDLGICADCERELLSPQDRRYRYPFINCTHCGPRFSILERVPYDRANTSMAAFAMCPHCGGEYQDDEDRRFHAQPNACAACGPSLVWLEPGGGVAAGDPIERFGQAMAAGKIVAVKGLGGFHLACDPYNDQSVRSLRERKQRDEKPFALMARNLAGAQKICEISQAEARELTSPRRPVVLLKRRPDTALSPAIAPGLDRLGLMLAYTPLHVLLTEVWPLLVMTSANLSDAPMPYLDAEVPQLWPLCDAVLTHNRPILRRVDDSVCAFYPSGRQLIRRARGFAPQPVPLVEAGGAAKPQVLAFGGQSKNTFCLLREGRAYLSSHMGDLDDARAYALYEEEIPAFLGLFGGSPEVLACDLHPDYASTRLAEKYAGRFPGQRLLYVQHHRAHFASVLGEHGLKEALGFIFDGTGYGEDGRIWGGEVFCGGITGASRVATLRPLGLIGGEAAIAEPWRVALYAVAQSCSEEKALSLFGAHDGAAALLALARRGAFTPLSSGMGRLFDAFAALAGLAGHAAYEGQAAIALEQAYDENATGSYRLEIDCNGPMLIIDWRHAVREAVKDLDAGIGPGAISARFHRGLIRMMEEIAALYPGLPIALSGGVFQNLRLLTGATDALMRAGRAVYTNQAVPPNDGGISFGQAAYAAALYGSKGGD